MSEPAAAAFAASPTSRSIAASRPASPSDVGHVMSSGDHCSGEAITRAMSSLVSTGEASRNRLAGGGASSSRAGPRPSHVVSDITRSSRSESIAGLVTCAKRCLKYENSDGARSLNAGSAPSAPIEPVGSFPVCAIGAIRMSRSSRV